MSQGHDQVHDVAIGGTRDGRVLAYELDYHIEDQKPGAKKCGHQGGKVLVGVDEQ